jgi:cobalt-precorrin 5A hydrolase/precorrin-3B C17-methyltransferase
MKKRSKEALQVLTPIETRQAQADTVLWVGIGCKRHTPKQAIATGIDQLLQQHGWSLAMVAGVATVDRKAKETGILAYCQDYHLPLVCFTPAALATVSVPTPAAVVTQAVGVASVAEAAALLAAQEQSQTATSYLAVPKQVIQLSAEGRGSVTLAIALQALANHARSAG